MRTPALATLVATGALAVAASGIVAAVLVDEDADTSGPEISVTPSVSASLTPKPEVSVRPSVTQMPPPETTAPVEPTPGEPSATVAPPAPELPVPDPQPTRSTIRYTVRGGDTLSDIAYWFTLNGYRQLYEDNRRVIGSDPDRIKPGQVYTIRNGLLRMS